MLFPPPAQPLRYDASLEEPEVDEGETGDEIIETMRMISETTYRDGGHAIRSVHAKSHGLLQGELEVLPQDYPVLAQGLFATPGRHPVIMRFSTTPGDILDDNVSTPRGLAIKVFDVAGDRLPGSEGQTDQDFVLINGPAFGAPNLKIFLANLKLLAGTTDKFPGLKSAISAVLQPIEDVLEEFGHPSGTLAALGGHPETNVLGETYFSQGALRFGDYVAKFAVAPASTDLVALHNKRVDLHDRPNGLRQAVVAFFADHGGEWDVRVQLCTDLDDMPIENAAKVWPEALSPYVTVARIRADPQVAWSEARSAAVDDGLSFSPWHGLAAHQPLGAVMRLRRRAYEAGTQFRASHNNRTIVEPSSFAPLPD
jgi:hypothetical protein